ncbi:MAG TPA: peptidylprolyl isomerase [Chloroflexota bacterium]|jgi:cyclophilin family peptidyl-prolyl cis-trans isomerase
MRRWRPTIVGAVALFLVAGCGQPAATAAVTANPAAVQAACGSATPSGTPQRTYSALPAMQIDVKKQYTATIQTQYGNIVIQLLPQNAPLTVNNFVFLACHGFYDGLIFHRVVPGFVIQGGDPQGTGAGGPGYSFKDELPSSSSVYTAGAVAMANSGPNTNGSQFFICTANDTSLPPNYTYFGKVTQGMDAVTAISKVNLTADPADPSGTKSKPVTPVVLQHVTIQSQ